MHLKYLVNFDQNFIGYLPRLGFNRLRQSVSTQTGEEGALVGVSIVYKQVIVGALRVHEGEV